MLTPLPEVYSLADAEEFFRTHPFESVVCVRLDCASFVCETLIEAEEWFGAVSPMRLPAVG